MLAQVPAAFASLAATLKPKLVISHDASGKRLVVDPFEGSVSLPGYTIGYMFGDADPNDPNTYTSVPGFFTATGASTLVGATFYGVPIWVIVVGGIGLIWLLRR